MDRLKTFAKYAVIILIFYIFSDILIFIGINGTYKTIKNYEILSQSPKVDVSESKATYINGYVNGNITNNTENLIDKTYIKIDFYSERNVNLGTKYIEIQNLKQNNTRDFRIAFKFTDVARYEISVVDEPVNATDEEFFSDEMRFRLLLSGLIMLYFM